MSKVTVTIRSEIEGVYDIEAVTKAAEWHAGGLRLALVLPENVDQRTVNTSIEIEEQ